MAYTILYACNNVQGWYIRLARIKKPLKMFISEYFILGISYKGDVVLGKP